MSRTVDRKFEFVFLELCMDPESLLEIIAENDFYLPKVIHNTGPKVAWSIQQANYTHSIHETSLLSTPLPLWTCIITLDN